MIILIISSEEYQLCSSSLYGLLQPPVTSVLGQNILVNTILKQNRYDNPFNGWSKNKHRKDENMFMSQEANSKTKSM
jgi:hypothetical protein